MLEAAGLIQPNATGQQLTTQQSTETYYQDIALYIFIAVFGLFIAFHVFDLKRKVIRWIFDIGTIFCALIINLLIVALILQPFQAGITPIWIIFISSALAPFFLAMLQSISS